MTDPQADLAELMAGASAREPLADAPGKSGARLERVEIDGRRYVLKHLDLAADWTMRLAACVASRSSCGNGASSAGSACINQPIVAVGYEPPGDAAVRPAGGCAVLMHDVADWLVPATDEPITAAQHAYFLRHMAALHAAYWDCGREYEVVPAMHRYLELSPWLGRRRRAVRSGTWSRSSSAGAGSCCRR